VISQRAFPILALLALGTVVYQQQRIGNFPPSPHVFVGVALVFSLLAVLAIVSAELASALALAVVLWLVFAYHGALNPATK
jgi:hypothetical protein